MLRWLPIWPFRSDDDNRLQLHASQPAGVVLDTTAVSQPESDRGWSTVVWSYYGTMLRQLQARFGAYGDVYAIGYDWRQDIEWLAGYAASKIDAIMQLTGAAHVAVVTHSMGGLVLRSALRKGLLNDKLASLIHVCIPAAGAVLLYRRMFTGMVSPYDGGGSVGDRSFRFLLGTTRQGFVGNMSGLPGANQLMPTSFFPPDAHGAAWNASLPGVPFAQLYGNASSPPGIVPLNIGLTAEVIADLQERVADSTAFDQFLGNPANKLHPETWSICGTAQQTETHISFQGGVANPFIEGLGDGTVPEVSALSLQLDPSRMFTAAVEHSKACEDATVQQHVVDILTHYIA